MKSVPNFYCLPECTILEGSLRQSLGMEKHLDLRQGGWMSVSVQFSSVAQSCPTLCDPMNRSTPGLPVHHHLLDFTQTHVHRVRDAIQPSHPQSSPSPPDPNPPSIRVFSNESTLRMRWPKYWSFSFSIIPSKAIPGLISFRMDWLDRLAVSLVSYNFLYTVFLSP